MRTFIRSMAYKYFISLIDGFIIEKKEEGAIKLIITFLLSILITAIIYYQDKTIDLCRKTDILSGILTFDGIVIGFLINALVLYLTLSQTDFLNQLKQKEYRIKRNNEILYVGKIKVSVYSYLLYKTLFIISLGIFLASIIIIKMAICSAPIDANKNIEMAIYFIITFISLYFMISFIRFINSFHSIIITHSLR